MRPLLTSVAATVLIVTLACSRRAIQPAVKAPATTPAAIVEVSGGKQISTVGTPLDLPLVIQVNDAQGAAVVGASVSFRSANGVAFQPDWGVTGADGQFTTAVTLGSQAGRYVIATTTTGAGGKPVELRTEELALGFEQNQGRQLSEVYCARCHDPESTPERVSNHDNLTAPPYAFSDGAYLNKMSDADLLAFIQHGGQALGKSAEMPPYGHTLNKSGIAALAAYIRAIADPPYQPREIVYAQK
ncbi:MAG TPA: c-type cytochrome [Bryobacteraceae bacterium]|nr:c-type cytochrome [Bryobacteraceae bacterium]